MSRHDHNKQVLFVQKSVQVIPLPYLYILAFLLAHNFDSCVLLSASICCVLGAFLIKRIAIKSKSVEMVFAGGVGDLTPLPLDSIPRDLLGQNAFHPLKQKKDDQLMFRGPSYQPPSRSPKLTANFRTA